ncbi:MULTISPECIES: pitrilysin family protein [unclassified Rhizobacter]|uniref:M16 family metallopeptidase n=1 Tax=unclassified Rhizobacter TaxID=2640088 RepID=UPI0006FD71E9|nr:MULTISPECIES: pitrilysin family protein [unclassified Rhizobacter]KQU77077.1 zinc protease [Rhizobacter sp. Root29]KQW14242.1 zinc protease [Rhizobacter sp. Root1238]KRB18607.1 zinc protease [Rhizobacter sp. Root16D2]
MLNRFLPAVLVVAGVLLVQPASAQALPAGISKVQVVEGIAEYRLPNGLQLLLIPDDSKPTTTVNMTYHVGSRMENYGETGMAHLLEHLLFKGTPKHRTVWSEFTKRGLAANGSTWFDRTNYFASFSANDDNLRWYLEWQADAMVNSFIARRDLDTEMTVVRNEMEMGENSPDRILLQKTVATMYEWHNYGKDTIGARADVENVDIPRLQAFYRQYYQPDNATLIVSGKFEPAKVLRWVGDAFGKIRKPTRKLPVQYTLDPAQDGERSVTLRRSGGTPQIFAAYHVPPAAHPDYPAIEVLDLVMGDTPSGRLHKRLTEKQLAASTFGFAQALAEPGFTLFGAQLAPGQAVEPARDALLATIESTAAEPITDEEFKRAQGKWLKAWEQAFTNPETVGVSLSESVAQGDWRLFFLLRDRVRDLKLADLQRVADQRFIASNRTLGTYLPTDKPQRAPAPAKVDVASEIKSFKPQQALATAEAFDSSPANIDQRTQRFQVGGIKAALLPKASRGGTVHATLTLHFGTDKSLSGLNDVPDMTAALLDKGTATLTRQQVQDRLDALKTEMAVSGGPGRVSVGLLSRRETLPQAIALVADLLRNASLPADALDELKRQTLAAIEQQRKEPESVLDNALARIGNPYPRGDVRYVRSFDEMVADVGGLKREQLQAFHRRFYSAAHGEFGAAGDMDVPAVKAALQAAFGDWQNSEPYARVAEPLVPVPPQRVVLPTPDKQNATMLVRLGVPLQDSDADYPALMMANYLLGSGGNSRLWKRIREADGLSYDVRSRISWNNQEPHSEWQASAIFAPQNQPKVEAAFKEEVARALKDGFTARELAEGQRGLLAFRRLSRAQDGNLGGALASNEELGRTFAVSARVDDALSKLTLEQVNAALRTYVKPDAFVSGFAGDFKP